jgi:phenylalanyl-tRNA synthetase alpha chain
MRTVKPPIRALLPGRCFRYEAIDASHGSEFFQVEGLMIDEGTTSATCAASWTSSPTRCSVRARRLASDPATTRSRSRPSAFDVECLVCGGPGCPACGRAAG